MSVVFNPKKGAQGKRKDYSKDDIGKNMMYVLANTHKLIFVHEHRSQWEEWCMTLT